MLQIKTVKNSLVDDPTKDGYCFRSSCSQKISMQELAKEMTSYNSSFTEADMVGMLSVLGTVMTNKLAEGYSVEFPIGEVYPTVSGTCSGIQDSFVLGHKNHQLDIGFTVNKATKQAVSAQLKYKQLSPDATNEARLYRLCSLQDNAKESPELSLVAGKTLRLHGKNLSFDLDDVAQGVFLENEDGKKRMTKFTRAGTNIIDVTIPADVSAGDYSVFVVTKPGTHYFTASIGSIVTVA